MSETIQVKASCGVAAVLTGIGEEWLYDERGEVVIARLWNGSFMTLNSLSQRSAATDGDTVILDTEAA